MAGFKDGGGQEERDPKEVAESRPEFADPCLARHIDYDCGFVPSVHLLRPRQLSSPPTLFLRAEMIPNPSLSTKDVPLPDSLPYFYGCKTTVFKCCYTATVQRPVVEQKEIVQG